MTCGTYHHHHHYHHHAHHHCILPDDVVLVAHPVASQHVAALAGDLQRLAAVVPLQQRDHLRHQPALLLEPAQLEETLGIIIIIIITIINIIITIINIINIIIITIINIIIIIVLPGGRTGAPA